MINKAKNNKKAISTGLIEEIYKEFVNKNKFPEKDRFEANYSQHIALLDELETDGVLQVRDSCYKLPLNEIIKLNLWKREGRIANKISALLKEAYIADPKSSWSIDKVLPKDELGLEPNDIKRAIYYLSEIGFIHSAPEDPVTKEIIEVQPHRDVLKYKTIEDKVLYYEKIRKKGGIKYMLPMQQKKFVSLLDNNTIWSEIQSEYGISRRQAIRHINRFINTRFKKQIILRDISQAYACFKLGFYKPAVILAGAVIEELLRIYLQYEGLELKDDKFTYYITTYTNWCRYQDINVKPGIAHLSHAIREYRNLVHLKQESGTRCSITKAIASGAISAIFTVINEL